MGERGSPAPTKEGDPPTRPRDPRLAPGWCPSPRRRPGTPRPHPCHKSPPPLPPNRAASATHDRWGRTEAASQAEASGARGRADGPSSVPASPVLQMKAQPPSRRQPQTGSPGARRAGPRRVWRTVASGPRWMGPRLGYRGASPRTDPSQPKGMYYYGTPSSTVARPAKHRRCGARRGVGGAHELGHGRNGGAGTWTAGPPLSASASRRRGASGRDARRGVRLAAAGGHGKRQPTGRHVAVAARCARNGHSPSSVLIASGDFMCMEGIICIGW